MWTRNNDVSNWNMLKHFIYLSSSKSTTSSLCSLYYRYSLKVSSFFCILSFLVIAISIDQTFYSATHYLAAVWLDSRHDFNSLLQRHSQCNDLFILIALFISESDSSSSSHATSESASMTSFVNAMIYKHIALFISESIYLKFLCQLVSLL